MTDFPAAYARIDYFPPSMGRALRYAMEQSPDRVFLDELATELLAFPLPEGAEPQSSGVPETFTIGDLLPPPA